MDDSRKTLMLEHVLRVPEEGLVIGLGVYSLEDVVIFSSELNSKCVISCGRSIWVTNNCYWLNMISNLMGTLIIELTVNRQRSPDLRLIERRKTVWIINQMNCAFLDSNQNNRTHFRAYGYYRGLMFSKPFGQKLGLVSGSEYYLYYPTILLRFKIKIFKDSIKDQAHKLLSDQLACVASSDICV